MKKYEVINGFEKEEDSSIGPSWIKVDYEQYRFLLYTGCFSTKNIIRNNIICNCVFMFLLDNPMNGSYYWKFDYNDSTTELMLGNNYVNIYSLLQSYPQNINEKINKILINLNKEIKSFGDKLDIDFITNYPRTFLPEGDDLYSSANSIYETICQSGLFDDNGHTFTIAGWQRLDELINKHNKKEKQIFIASKFKDNKETIDAIKSAISGEHFVSVTLYEYQTNNYIMPEMFNLIKDSVAIVADITDENPNVMFEVGFAKGVGVEVILVSKSEFDDKGEAKNPIHSFDVSQISIVYYKDLEDLVSKLGRRIKHTID